MHGVHSSAYFPARVSRNFSCRKTVESFPFFAKALRILLSRQFDYAADYVPRDVKWESLLWREKHISAYCRLGNIYFRWQTLLLFVLVVHHLRSMLGSDNDGKFLLIDFFAGWGSNANFILTREYSPARVSEYFIFDTSSLLLLLVPPGRRCEMNFFGRMKYDSKNQKKKTEKRRESKVMRSSRSTRQDKLVWFGPRHGTECKPISLKSHRQIIITERNRRKHVSANSECFHFSQIFFLNRINWIFCVKITIIIIIISGVLSFFFVQKLWDKYFSFRQSANNNITSKWQRRCTVDRKNLEFLARNLQRKNHCGTLADSCCKSHLLVLFSIETFTSLDTDRARAER